MYKLSHSLRLIILLCISAFLFAYNSLGQHPEEGGILENISNEVLAKKLMNKALILDVRTPDETQLGIIEGATVINFYDDDFEAKVELMEKSKPIVVYCASGGRSSEAASILAERGFMEVYNLEGGLIGWQNEGLPVIKAVSDLASTGINAEELKSLIQESDLVLLDFYAPWCAPCKGMAPIIDDIEKNYGASVRVERVDIAANPDLGKAYNVASVPVFALYQEGKEIWRSNGFTEQSVLVDQIKQNSKK